MAAKNKVTVSVAPAKHRPTTAERRAAATAALSTKQQDLKREAEQRRAKRALDSANTAPPVPRKTASARRSYSR
jgi:hypothetical protein